jgi:hypothetical protein
MLEMRPDCETCGVLLPAEAPGAFICSFECTFCAECAEDLDDRCPNCGGELIGIPTYGATGLFFDADGGGAHGLNEKVKVQSV